MRRCGTNDLDLLCISGLASMAEQDFMTMKPLGYMHTVFQYKNGTPRQPSLCSTARGSLTVDKNIFNNPEHSLEGLEQYSHAWILFVFHKNNKGHTKAKVKPPRLNGQKVGVFSTRSPYRPNAIGLTLAKIERISGATVHFSGIDIVDGTPVLDLKPFIPQYDCPKCGHGIFNATFQEKEIVRTEQDEDVNMQRTDYNRGYPNDTVEMKAGIDSQWDDPIKAATLGSGEARAEDSLKGLTEVASLGSVPRCVEASGVGHSGAVAAAGLNEEAGVLSLHTAAAADTTSVHGILSEAEEPRPGLRDTDKTEDGTLSSNDLENAQAVLKETSLPDACCDVSTTQSTGDGIDVTNAENYKQAVNSAAKATRLTSQQEELSSKSQDTSVASWLASPPVTKLKVTFTPTAEDQLKLFARHDKDDALENYRLDFLSGENEIRDAISSVLSEDPRSVYRRKKCADLLYFFTVDRVHVTCWFDENRAEVVRLQPVSMVTKLLERSDNS